MQSEAGTMIFFYLVLQLCIFMRGNEKLFSKHQCVTVKLIVRGIVFYFLHC